MSRQSSTLETQSVLLAFFFQGFLFFFVHGGNEGLDVRGRGFTCSLWSYCWCCSHLALAGAVSA
jgi:hypothetical protein